MSDIDNLPLVLLIPHYLMHSCIYYELNDNLITDSDYDALARRVDAEWDNLTHMHKHLIDRSALSSGGSYIKFTNMIRSAANYMLRNTTRKTFLSKQEQAMAKINSRSKGQRGEREVIDMLQPHIDEVSAYNQVEPPFLQRNQMQSHQGGYDIVGLPLFAFEVKRVENETPGAVAGWWAQCVSQAKNGEEPVLLYRLNGRKWSVMIFTRLDLDAKRRYKVPSVIRVEDFIFYMKTRLHCHQVEQKNKVDA